MRRAVLSGASRRLLLRASRPYATSTASLPAALRRAPRPASLPRGAGAVRPVPSPYRVRLFSALPPHITFPMPALSPTMETGSIACWHLQEGESFAAGDVLCEVETDKATVDYEAQDDGVLAKILQTAGSGDIPVGVPICIVVEEEAEVPAFADYTVPDTAPAEPAAEPAAAAPAVAPVNAGPSFLMPSARHMAESAGLDATGLAGTGKGGRVTKADVLTHLHALPPLAAAAPPPAASAPAPADRAAPSPPAAPAAASVPPPAMETMSVPSGFTDEPNSNMRKIIAKRLSESKRSVPHFYTSAEVRLDAVLALRKRLVREFDVKVSVNDLVLKSAAMALRDVPEVNATYDAATGTKTSSPTVDISVAVATPAGLITPIVTDADKRTLADISGEVRDLAGRARDNKLKPEEFQGGSFTISNLGMFGVSEFSAVINPPQAAILAVGGGEQRVVPAPQVEGQERGAPEVVTIMTARLSADRRVVDEATAAAFMEIFEMYLGRPELLLL